MSEPNSVLGRIEDLPNSTAQQLDIAAWAAIQRLNLGIGDPTRSGVPLSISLDQPSNGAGSSTLPIRRLISTQLPLSRKRDRSSLRRREALLQGTEGSRRRRRWENSHFKNVPNAQPPEPRDWFVQPTHPVVHVPYHLARLWDDIAAKESGNSGRGVRQSNAHSSGLGRVTREIREAAKRSPAFKSWVRSYEDPLRWFVETRQAVLNGSVATLVDEATSPTTTDESDYEVVVVRGRGLGRTSTSELSSYKSGNSQPGQESIISLQREDNWQELYPTATIATSDPLTSSYIDVADCGDAGHTNAHSWRVVPARAGQNDNGPAAMLFTPDGPAGTSYARWIVHSVAIYYGLHSASVNDSEEVKRRYVFVGPKNWQRGRGSHLGPADDVHIAVPPPLWELL